MVHVKQTKEDQSSQSFLLVHQLTNFHKLSLAWKKMQ